MSEQWRDIVGYEGRYQVSDLGGIKALAFQQRYVHWRDNSSRFRTTKEHILATQSINSGYLIAHLHLNNKRKALLVHRLVAEAFLGAPTAATVNHKNGVKTDNAATNLEWATYTENHLHAVSMRLNKQAVPVADPQTGTRYSSIAQAAKAAKKSHRKVSASFTREDAHV